jgi:hypothetical protein
MGTHRSAREKGVVRSTGSQSRDERVETLCILFGDERKKPGSFAGSEREYFYSFQRNNNPVSFLQEKLILVLMCLT